VVGGTAGSLRRWVGAIIWSFDHITPLRPAAFVGSPTAVTHGSNSLRYPPSIFFDAGISCKRFLGEMSDFCLRTFQRQFEGFNRSGKWEGGLRPALQGRIIIRP
jgi:hypothetical protein